MKKKHKNCSKIINIERRLKKISTDTDIIILQHRMKFHCKIFISFPKIALLGTVPKKFTDTA